ncbi:SDR family NAD(P)-dependent oxidoreductase [Streptomyces sp. NBC_01669]|uniref:SDR family NAD(P)-dependent oxidoreductase n=1 Tax=Streptomyces sp. NBC_01669 TaxID=2975909 RepID=UPI00224D989E|nr:SDR family NAD(P)-dependent oxidoreductase [Streptomyces sp. NBC_01669]MCX4530932.1 SDR family NAD(P)-dependent oxidoreductase [Streptomyces sp. NBC_01669]
MATPAPYATTEPAARWLDGDVALITGGAGGLGRAVALRYLAEGARVAVFDQDAEQLTALVGAAGGHADRVLAVTGDVRSTKDLHAAVAGAVERFGKLDILVPNAGIWDYHRSLTRLTGEELAAAFDEVFAVNVKGYLLAVEAAWRELVATRGSIINLWRNAVNVDTMVDTRPGHVNLALAPLFHIGGLNALTLRTLTRGVVVVRRSFDPEQCLADLVAHRVTSIFAVPAMFAALTRAPGFREADLSALRAVIVAGAAVPPQLIRDYAESHGVLLQQAWGLTETAPFATYLPAARTLEKTGSAGLPMPYTEVCLMVPGGGGVIDEPQVRGEICVRGPNVVAGYWNNQQATREAFDDAGWFHSGDIGYRNEDGHYYVVDRLKDMIISGGENVYPAEVERVLSSFPGVHEVAVVGIPDPKWGETVVAVLTCEPGVEPTLQEVRDFGSGRLARYKLPTRVVLAPELPRNASGKLVKGQVRDIVTHQAGPTGN